MPESIWWSIIAADRGACVAAAASEPASVVDSNPHQSKVKKGEPGQPASQSLMGFVLLRTKPDGRYDVHIAFRGRRSGSGARATLQAFDTHDAAGDPDWITDMGTDRVVPGQGAEYITTTSAVSRGFARSMKSIVPQVFACLNMIADIGQGASPDTIYVTGHSMGGALAQRFLAARSHPITRVEAFGH